MAELARILIVDDNPKYLEDISVDCIGTKMYSYQKDNIIKLYNNDVPNKIIINTN